MIEIKLHDDIQKMNMHDLAHNQFFIKEGWTWYRDFDREINCFDLVREIATTLDCEELLNLNNEELGEELFEALQYGTDNKLGIIAMYYSAMWAMANIVDRGKDCGYVRS